MQRLMNGPNQASLSGVLSSARGEEEVRLTSAGRGGRREKAERLLDDSYSVRQSIEDAGTGGN